MSHLDLVTDTAFFNTNVSCSAMEIRQVFEFSEVKSSRSESVSYFIGTSLNGRSVGAC